MAVKFFNFRVPHGTAMQPYADGSYNIVYDEKNTVALRDFFANLTNTLTDNATKYLEEQQEKEKRVITERAERAKAAAFPVSKAIGLEKEKRRINTHLSMMGNSEVPGGTVLDRPPTLAPPKPSLIPAKANRVVQTITGPIEVAPDVSDADIRALGYVLSGDAQSPLDGPSANGQEPTSATDVEHSDSPVEEVL